MKSGALSQFSSFLSDHEESIDGDISPETMGILPGISEPVIDESSKFAERIWNAVEETVDKTAPPIGKKRST